MTQPREAPIVEDLSKRFANPEVPGDIQVIAREHDAVSIVTDLDPVAAAKAHPYPIRARQAGDLPPARWPRWWRYALLLLAFLLHGAVAVHAEFDSKVEAVQRALAERGYDPGTIDGAMGQRTAAALRDFQRLVGLPDTGEIDDATWGALGLELVTGAKRRPEQHAGAEAKEADTPLAEARSATLQADANRIDPGTAPGEDTTHAEASRAEPTPAVSEKPRLGFSTLGWHPPQTGAEALARFDEIGAPPRFRRGKGTLFVPKGELVFVLGQGERFPGLECDPGAGRLSIEFVFGPDGPVIFTPTGDGEFCQAGIGIVIEVGRTLAIRRIDWGDLQLPQGTVRVTGRGLEYVD